MTDLLFSRQFAVAAAAALFTAGSGQAALVNLSLTGTANGSSADYGTVFVDAIDGNRNSNYAAGSVWHSTDPGGGVGSPVFYEVTLPAARVLDHLTLFNRMDAVQGSVTNFRITAYNGATQVFSNTYLPSSSTHGLVTAASVAWGTDDLRGITATRVRIERLNTAAPNFMTFAELELWGSGAGQTMAPYITPASLSASPAGFLTSIGNGADGNIEGSYNYPGNPIYHSAVQGAGQFWEMNLGGSYSVSELLVFNRTDAITTTTVRISLFNAANVETWFAIQDLSRGTGPTYNYELDLPVGAVGQRIRVETVGNEFLAFGEIQAFGTPVPEPSFAALGLAGLGFLLARRRPRA